MKKYYDKDGDEIKAGMSLLWEYSNGSGSCINIIEHNDDLGFLDICSLIDNNFDKFISLSELDYNNAKINFIPSNMRCENGSKKEN